MMKYLLSIGIGLLLLGSCTNKEKLPKNIMDKEKMEVVLWGLMQVDQYLMDFVFNKDTSLDKFEEYTRRYQDVFQIHQTNKEEFSRSFDYYRAHPALIKEVFDSISTRKRLEIPDVDQPVKTDDSLLNKKKRLLPRNISVE